MANIGTTYDEKLEKEVVELYEVGGLSIAKIVDATGVRERRVKELIRGKTKAAKTPTQLDEVSAIIYDLAVSSYGVSNDEVRTICHRIYGSTWDPSNGKYKSNFDQSIIDRVKRKIRDKAAANDKLATFRPSWMNPEKATACREWMESFAIEMQTRFAEGVSEFMNRFAIDVCDDDEGDRVLAKQYYSASRHIKTLSSGLGAEPVSDLLQRVKKISDRIDGTTDLALPNMPAAEIRRMIPEPKRECYNAFYDEIERTRPAPRLAA